MAVVRVPDFVELYRRTARRADLHALSGRGDREDLTRFTNEKIVGHLQLSPEDVVVDVGCGDGSLLRSIADRIQKGIGIAPTPEEVGRLTEAHASVPNLEFSIGRAEDLPLADGVATKVVCNGVLILLPDEQVAARALAELARITKVGGSVFVGEHPETDEIDSRVLYGGSLRKRIRYLRRPGAVRASLAVLRDMLRAKLGAGEVVVPPQTIFYCTAERLRAMAKPAGLVVRWSERHMLRERDGTIRPSPTRLDHLLERVAESE